MHLLEEQASPLARHISQLGIPPSYLALCFVQQAQIKTHLCDLDLFVALGVLTLSSPGSWVGGPGQDFVLLCLYSRGDDAMSEMALEPIGAGEDIFLLVIIGREPWAASLRGVEWNLLGVSAAVSLKDRRLKRLKAGDFKDEGWATDCGDIAVLW